MITKRQYLGYLLTAPVHYTCSNLAEHLDGVSHDKELPFRVRLFEVVATNGDIDWIIPNASGPITTQAVGDENARRWPIEQFHREFKQLTGSEKCQCRIARSQRNDLGCCHLARGALGVQANRMGGTVCRVRERIFDALLTLALQKPPIRAYLLT